MKALDKIDQQLRCECAILVFERRSGERANAVRETWARIDALLEQRFVLTRNLTPA